MQQANLDLGQHDAVQSNCCFKDQNRFAFDSHHLLTTELKMNHHSSHTLTEEIKKFKLNLTLIVTVYEF